MALVHGSHVCMCAFVFFASVLQDGGHLLIGALVRSARAIPEQNAIIRYPAWRAMGAPGA